jgi:LysR family transcriptional regulator, hydrogen peroxide-inducible genes activator
MNLQQLEYIVAIDECRHFVKAAEKCNVTQPTLSMMVQKLEEEMNFKIFDRGKSPVEPTAIGIEVIHRAKKILVEVSHLKEFAKELRNEISGTIRLGVIPTLAPYLLPLFIEEMIEKYPLVKITIKDLATNNLIEALKTNQIDIGILATPLNDTVLKELPLFYEEFLAYSSSMENFSKKDYILPGDVDVNQLWLLEEGHCFRNQVLNFCELKHSDLYNKRLSYEAGSIETLINFVDKNNGITVIPFLAAKNFSEAQKAKMKRFCEPQPVREISLVVNKSFPRLGILEALKKEILNNIPDELKKSNKKIVSI